MVHFIAFGVLSHLKIFKFDLKLLVFQGLKFCPSGSINTVFILIIFECYVVTHNVQLVMYNYVAASTA